MDIRLNYFRKLLAKQKLDAALVSSPSSISYLTGYQGFSNVEREAFLLITPKNNYLITDARYTEATIASVPHFTTLERNHEQPVSKLLQKYLDKEKIGIIGFESTDISVAEYASLKKSGIKFVSFDLRDLRISKVSGEIANIQHAAKIANSSLQKVKTSIQIGVTEIEIAKKLEAEFRKNNADVAFPTIVAFGKNAAIPHHMTGKTKLKKNDLVLVDFGAKWNGYCSDTTRTFFVGEVPDEWKKIYETVEEAQRKVVDFLRNTLYKIPNTRIKASELDKIARDHIISKGYPPIPYSLGHGIGLEVHEAPSLSPQSKDILTEGMVFSIEPGIYLPGKLGVRIEDLFLIQKSELTKLT